MVGNGSARRTKLSALRCRVGQASFVEGGGDDRGGFVLGRSLFSRPEEVFRPRQEEKGVFGVVSPTRCAFQSTPPGGKGAKAVDVIDDVPPVDFFYSHQHQTLFATTTDGILKGVLILRFT